MKTEHSMRLNKFLARAGLGSRRAVEDIIREGRVSINGDQVKDLGRQVDPDHDQVQVDGNPVHVPHDYRVYAFHKPLDVVSTLKAQGGQPALRAFRLQSDLPDRFVPVGRLDSESTGLLLWTDDGKLNQMLARPKTGVWKVYEVELNEPPSEIVVPQLTSGKIEIDGRPCLPCRLRMAPDKTTRHWIMELQEGRRRQIRRMFKKVGLKVLKLHRVQVGPIKLGLLRAGDFRRLTQQEVQELYRTIETAKAKPDQGSPKSR
nr:pseudouridine synthase [Candidatus Krumholzibacteria bacterium]